MMKLLLLSLFLTLAAALLYVLHYYVYKDVHHIGIFLVSDLAFLPLEFIFVYIVLNNVLKGRGESIAKERMNSMMGIFFSELGKELLFYFNEADTNKGRTNEFLLIDSNTSQRTFKKRIKELRSYEISIDVEALDLHRLHKILKEEKDHLLNILGNSGTMESNSTTYIFHSLFNLMNTLDDQETSGQYSLSTVHVSMGKLYKMLIYRWLHYMKHLHTYYPDYYESLTKSFDVKNDRQ